MRRLPIAFILAIFLPLICAGGDEPRDYGDFLTDIVTYEGSSDDGTAMFSFQSRDDLPLQRLASSIKLPSDIVAGQRCLLRYTVVGNLADGTPQLDANTGTQAVFDNLLILYSGSSLRDDGRTLDYDLSMGGGVWLNGGHLWQVTWTQGTQSTLALYDSNGKPLNLPAGRSYIALLSSLTGQELLVQSSTGEALVGAG